MHRRKKAIKYQFAIPPLNKPFSELSSQEAKEFFDWYMKVLPSRIQYLSRYCDNQRGNDAMDLSPESLIPLWRWFLIIARKESTSKWELEQLAQQYKKCPLLKDYMLDQSKEKFSLETEFILRDIGMYLGAVFVKNNPSILWGYYEQPKTDFFVNTPLLQGFVDTRFEPPFPMVFEPIHMVGVQAANIWDNTQSNDDLLCLYRKWLKYIPQK